MGPRFFAILFSNQLAPRSSSLSRLRDSNRRGFPPENVELIDCELSSPRVASIFLCIHSRRFARSPLEPSQLATSRNVGCFLRLVHPGRSNHWTGECEGNRNSLRVRGRFELSRVRVIEGKITVNVWSKSRGNQFWFELARASSYRGFQLPRVNWGKFQLVIISSLPDGVHVIHW